MEERHHRRGHHRGNINVGTQSEREGEDEGTHVFGEHCIDDAEDSELKMQRDRYNHPSAKKYEVSDSERREEKFFVVFLLKSVFLCVFLRVWTMIRLKMPYGRMISLKLHVEDNGRKLFLNGG